MKKHLLLALTSLLLLGNFKDARSQTGTALNFDGADDYVSISNYTGIPTGNSNYTLEAWINPGFTAARYGIIGLGNYGSSNTVNALRTADAGEGSGIVNYWWSGGDMTVTQAEIGFSIYDGNWHHIAVTYDGTNKSCYVDGNLKKTMAVSAPNVAATNFTIGKTCCTEYFFGGMDEVRIWNIARTQAEIQNYMNCPVKNNPASLIANYSFNDGLANGTNTTNTTLYDVTGNGHNGTLTNFALSGAGSNFVTDIRADYLSQQSSIGSTGAADRLASAVAGDFNGDGLNDIIATSDNGDARLYLNGGKGNFPNSFTTIIPATGGNFDVADIDNDGDMDFTHADYTSTVKVYINNGAAVFTPISIILNGTGAASVTKIADVNNDGKLDVIIGNNANGATDNTEVWWNTGTTGSAAFTFKAGLANTQPSKGSIAVGDIDGDGDKDIITGSSSWSAELSLNNGNNGTFTTGTAPAGYGGGVMLLDWDQDGKLDYLNYDPYNNYGLRFKKGDGAGNFASTAVILLQAGTLAGYCRLNDMNGDGFLDAIIANWGGDATIYINNGCALTLQNGCNYTLGHSDNGIVVSDFNNDGKTDVFCEARDFASTFYMNYLTPVVTPALSNIITTTPNSICGSGTVVLGATASNSGTVNWYSVSSGGSSLAAGTSYTTGVISSTTTYYVDATNSNGCTSSRTAVIATVKPLPTVTISGATTICNGQSAFLTANGANTYVWDNGQTTATHAVSPTSNTTYTVTGTTTSTGCSNSATHLITVNSLPNITISGTATICNGQSTVLTGNGADDYAWDDGQSTATNTVSPTSNTTYTVTGTTTSTGCSNSATQLVTVNSLPNVTISGTTTICNGQSTVLTGNGANTFTWTSGPSAASNTVSPTSNTTYTVTGTTTSTGCSNTATQLVTVNALPVITSQSGNVKACGDVSASFSVTSPGTNTYQWNYVNTVSPFDAAVINGTYTEINYTTANMTITQLITGLYDGYAVYCTVTNSNNCSINSNSDTITVKALPTVTITGTATICNGASTTLTGNGADTYVWDGGQTTTSNTVSPTSNTTYTVTGTTTSTGCSNSATQLITVNNLPNVTISGTATICNGQSTVLTGNGANTYVWTSGPSTTSNTVSPTSNTTYTVTGTTTSTGCSNSATQLVTVNNLPVVTTSGTATNPSGCGATDGSVSGFVVSGSPTLQYSWNGGASQSTPDITNIGAGAYSLVITDGNGCTQNGGTFSLSDPGAPPAPTFTVSSAPICEGGSFTLTINSPNGSATYSWSGPSGVIGTGTVITVSNATAALDNGNYSAQINLSGCTSSSASQNIIINALPTVSITGISAICSGTGTTLTGSGATSYTWSANAGSVNTSTASVSPSATDTYTLTGENNGCSASNTITVNVTATPTLTISGSTSVCLGSSTILTANGATTYTWSSNAGSATTSTVSVSPTSNDTYTVSGNNGNCSDVTTVSVTVNSLPSVTFDVNPNQLCSTDPAVTLSATPSNGTFTGTGVSSNQFDPSVAGVGSYTLTYNYTDGNNCSNNDTAQVSVILCTTGINQVASSSVNIYPNPASTVINIVSSDLGANSVLEIYNSLGQKVSSVILSSTSTQVSVTDLNNGIYEARIISDNTIVYKARIVKQF